MRVKSTLIMVLAGMVTLWALGCGGSSGPSKGQGPAGIASATVCLDLNDNYACDTNEPSVETDAEGKYELSMEKSDLKEHRLLWVSDGTAVVSETGAVVGDRYVLASVIGSAKEISVFSTILSVQTTVNEAALKTSLGITESKSLLGGYASDGEIAGFVAALTSLYADIYAGVASDAGLSPSQVVGQVAATLIADASFISEYVDDYLSDNPLAPSNAATTSTTVGEEIFQSIPIDAATMSFGVGMDELSRQVVSGAYCLEGLQAGLTPELSLCQNTRSYLFRLVKSEKDLRELLNVGGGLDLGTAVISGSLEGRYVDEMRSDSSSIYALIKAEYVLCGYKLFDVIMDDLYLNGDSEHASYTNNYEAFRTACGDRYLNTVTTGGSYYGLLKIQTSSYDHKKDLTVKLEGKYGKAGISVSVRGDLQSSVSEVIENENVTIIVGSRGVSPEFLGLENGEDQLIDNLEDFFDAADQFMDAISDSTNECHDDAVAFKNCAYTASFADYATVALANTRNGTQAKNLKFTKKLMGQYEDYNILEKYIGDILAHSGDYDWTGHTKSEVYSYKNYLYQGKLIMDAAFNKCLTDFTGCTNNTEASSLKTFNEILRKMPFERWIEPEDCSDLQRLLGDEDTDSATVSLGGDETKPYLVSCRKMDTSEPETYLELANTSGSVSTPSYNSAVNVNANNSETTTIYRKYRINVNDNNLEVVYDQEDATSTYPTAATMVRPGSAMDCNATTGRAKSNIDLTGTIFTIDPIVSFQTTVAPQTSYRWVSTAMTFDNAKTYAEAQGGRLVEFDDAIEFATLRDDLLTNHAGAPSWIGMRRLDTAATPGWKQFKWIYKNQTITEGEYEAYFHNGEPNNAGGTENCIHFWSDAMLNDVTCTLTYPFYIEFNYNVPTGTAAFNGDRTAVDVTVSGADAGKCAEIKPTVPIRLIYND